MVSYSRPRSNSANHINEVYNAAAIVAVSTDTPLSYPHHALSYIPATSTDDMVYLHNHTSPNADTARTSRRSEKPDEDIYNFGRNFF